MSKYLVHFSLDPNKETSLFMNLKKKEIDNKHSLQNNSTYENSRPQHVNIFKTILTKAQKKVKSDIFEPKNSGFY